MSQSDTTLPMVIAAEPRPAPRRLSPKSAFLSQLIAERDRHAPQRARRRATPAEAVDAYAAGSRITVLRMPAGYRRTVVA